MRPPTPVTRKAAPTAQRSLLAREPVLLSALLLALFYFARPLLIPLAFAFTLAFLLAPVVTWLQRLRLRRAPATFLALAAATALLGGVVYLVTTQLLTVVNDLPSHAPNIRVKLARTHVPPGSALGQAVTSIEGLSREFSAETSGGPAAQAAQQQLQAGRAGSRARRAVEAARAEGIPQPTPVVVLQPPPSELATLRALARPILGPLSTAGMVLIFTTYMLLKRENLRNRLLLLAGIGRLNLVSHALDDAAARISRYLTANALVNAGFGLIFGAALYAIGIPYAVLWGSLFALLRTIPYAGTFLGGALPFVFALIYFPGFWQAGCTLAFLLLLEVLVTNLLEPWLYGAHTGISELGLLTMAIFWSLLWGWPGLALSTPLTACLIVAGRTLPQMSFLHILLGDDAELAPEAHFYERMLATDSAEARLIAERFLSRAAVSRKPRGRRSAAWNSSPASAPPRPGPASDLLQAAGSNASSNLDLYEAILLPALALAENDRHRGLLAEPQAAFILQSIAELVAELTTYSVQTASSFPLSALNALGCPVVCIPALDLADEIAATMLAQLLEASGHKTLLLPPSALAPDLLQRFAETPETALCISALPPFAFAGARALYTRLRAELPHNPITIALWRSPTDPQLLAARLGIPPGAGGVAVTLASTLAAIEAAAAIPATHPDIYARPTLAHSR